MSDSLILVSTAGSKSREGFSSAQYRLSLLCVKTFCFSSNYFLIQFPYGVCQNYICITRHFYLFVCQCVVRLNVYVVYHVWDTGCSPHLTLSIISLNISTYNRKPASDHSESYRRKNIIHLNNTGIASHNPLLGEE